MSQTTKRALAASLKKLASQKPLDKITITDITEDCEVNRQTFYYHFQDIYDLVEWIFISENRKAIDGNKTYDTWQHGFLCVFEYVLQNKDFVTSVYHSVSREHLERYSVRTGMEAVYTLLDIDRGVPEVWDSCYEVRTLLNSTSKLMDGKKLTDLKLPIIATLVEKRVLQKTSGTVIGALLQKYNLV